MNSPSRYRTVRKVLIFWCLFIGIGAVAGAVGMLVKPDGSALGMQALLPYFQVLPLAEYLYQDFVFPGIALLLVNGIPNLTAAGLLFANKRAGILAGGIFGITLMLWICIQFVIFPANSMSTIYFIFGFLQAVTGFTAWVFYRQEQFTVREEDYPNIGTDPKQLVVYFSRMGYTKKAAMERANQLGAELYEIVPTERTVGTAGFWWCGRYGMHRWAMPIKEPQINWKQYERVTICTPIWVFRMAAPVRSFCQAASGKIKNADYILLHYQRSKYQNAAEEMDQILNTRHSQAESICCRKGDYQSRVFLKNQKTSG